MVITTRALAVMMLFVLLSIVPSLASGDSDGHRFWRILSPGDSRWAVIELRWLDADLQEISTMGATPIASGEHASWANGAAGMDNDESTYWSANVKADSEDRWLGVDFGEGAAVAVAEAEVMQYNHEVYRVFRAYLEYSDDGVVWDLYDQADLEDQCDQCELFWEKIPGEPKFDHLDFL
mmetsp:Transcript_18221/g.42579  ORF Transcript_18221/g.42579 Transcript_18221/m.42579 type:complete len:179 (-) Transcript_18221:159-695(-)|eukprot:CAMPEP_0119541162 /NCGR_PEP_ID=MMETSP1344-20130328/52796_1 /TAXON_ID=236787 /ORGANISM="Florenciella parvula, Strain CCMP2471" /LENGTH=178 /DNA_ID=CAMNT_0007585093 /DNA_START=38 /DNA_END=574 /DNA_ORIENTATION=+